ncbi:unnamed protein product [Closterium sp. Naga37s-1]|nr:unnamed protein product [Closterium sp. Naga37s-1]
MVQRAKAFVEAGLTPPAALQALLLRERRAGGRGGESEEGSEEGDDEDSEDERVEGLLAWKDERGRARSGGNEGEESGVGERKEGAVEGGKEGREGAVKRGKCVGMEVEMKEMATEGMGGGEGANKAMATEGKGDTSRESSGEEGSREEGEVSDSDDGEEGEEEGKQQGEEVGDRKVEENQGLLGAQEGHRMEEVRDDVIRAEEGEQQQAAESKGAAVVAEQRKQGKELEGKPEQGGEGGGQGEQGGQQAGQRGGKLWVRVERREEIEAQRAGLPVVAMEGEVMEAVGGSNAVLVCGETGSGKTTQVPQVSAGVWGGEREMRGWGEEGEGTCGPALPSPCAAGWGRSGRTTQVPQVCGGGACGWWRGGGEGGAEFLYEAGYGSSLPGGTTGMIAVTEARRVAFLYEAGYGSSLPGGTPGMIAVTQPRRVAVLATAKRIADEMGVTVGREVGYQVRYDRHVAGGTAIKIMTDGILLREVQADLLLRQYSAVVLDEAHERSVNTDILVGLLSRIVPLRQARWGQREGG